mmetsp:Transcript_4952/g.6525  ORF Transcript_4952/g.6525 Transcript_4952/m.6525 type:complete len:522 (-) Transcript_4952:371-1936(-)
MNEHTPNTPWAYNQHQDSFVQRARKLSIELSHQRQREPSRSYEFIYPAPVSDDRQSGVLPAIFNLCSTVLGGGILSLPYTFAKLGWGLGLIVLVGVALASDFALYILCSCSRRSGTINYVEVAKHAFGEAGGYFVTMMLSIFILFIVVAYQVLLRDIASGIVEFFIGYDLDMQGKTHVLIVCIAILSPLCFFNSLYSLRYTCYLGFAAVCLLTASLVYSATELNMQHPNLFNEHAMTATTSITDILYVLPILAVSYVCQFNMLSVHSKLKHPTRQRMRSTIHGAIGIATVIYALGATAGYLYGYEHTNDNIFNNFAPSDRLLLVGRMGLFVTLMCAMPMMVLPCRENSLLLLEDLIAMIRYCATSKQEREVLLERASFSSQSSTASDRHVLTPSMLLEQNSEELEQQDGYHVLQDAGPQAGPMNCEKVAGLAQHVVSTVTIVLVALYLAVCIPGVAVVWSIAGSTLGLIISFFLPAACYLKIRWKKKRSKVKQGAAAMMVVSAVLIVFCSYQSISHALAGG